MLLLFERSCVSNLFLKKTYSNETDDSIGRCGIKLEHQPGQYSETVWIGKGQATEQESWWSSRLADAKTTRGKDCLLFYV